MFTRITNLMINNNVNLNIGRHNREMSKTEENLASGTRIHLPSDDPASAASQMHYRSRLTELAQYDRNVSESQQRLNLMDSQLSSVTDIMQRIRYLTVQGANGINTDFEMREAIGREVDEHLRALLDLGNVKDSTGRPLFGGSMIERDPFEAIYSAGSEPEGESGAYITGVRYQGDIQTQKREIERFESMDISIPGNKVFWGTNTSLASNKDSSQYTALGDQQFSIDGIKIQVNAGDGIDDIINKINSTPLEVRAARGGQDDIILTSKTPHQMWLEDLEGGTVLQDLGLIDSKNQRPPNNYHAQATVSGLSLFDVVIQLREDLRRGDHNMVGGRDLEAIDMAMENVLRYRAETGARSNRVEEQTKRLAMDQTYMQNLLSKNEDIDVAEEIMNLKMLESVHQYALRVGAGLIKPTLMDFLR